MAQFIKSRQSSFLTRRAQKPTSSFRTDLTTAGFSDASLKHPFGQLLIIARHCVTGTEGGDYCRDTIRQRLLGYGHALQ